MPGLAGDERSGAMCCNYLSAKTILLCWLILGLLPLTLYFYFIFPITIYLIGWLRL